MITKRILPFIALLLLASVTLAACSPENETEDQTTGAAGRTAELISGVPQEVPIPGMVTMVDIGAHACVPCKMMTPIIEELSREYDSRAAIVFIDVWEHQDQTEKFGIRSIPTQIFYNTDGIEQFRHVGFLDKASIEKKLTELGVK